MCSCESSQDPSQVEPITGTQLGDLEVLLRALKSASQFYPYIDKEGVDRRIGEARDLMTVSMYAVATALPVRFYGANRNHPVDYAVTHICGPYEPRVPTDTAQAARAKHGNDVATRAFPKVESTGDPVKDGELVAGSLRDYLNDEETVECDSETGVTTWYLSEPMKLDDRTRVTGFRFHPITEMNGEPSINNHGFVTVITAD